MKRGLALKYFIQLTVSKISSGWGLSYCPGCYWIWYKQEGFKVIIQKESGSYRESQGFPDPDQDISKNNPSKPPLLHS